MTPRNPGHRGLVLFTLVLAVTVFGLCRTAMAATPQKSAGISEDGYVPHFDGQKAFDYTREIVAFGTRPPGSEGHKRVEAYIHSKLKGDAVEDDHFTANTPAGKFEGVNIIARYPGTKDGVILVGSHYDTNYPLPKSYVGANDGASTSGLLLEMAGELRGRKLDGYSVWLVWFDAEEAFREWTSEDSAYGSKHLAGKWKDDGTLKKVKAFLLTDMIGDKDLNVDRDYDSTPWLEDLVGTAATSLGYQSHFFARTVPMEDDHTPFKALGVPCADLIDFTYGYNNVFWHTPQDTLDKLSPKSLQIVGEVVLESIHLLNAK